MYAPDDILACAADHVARGELFERTEAWLRRDLQRADRTNGRVPGGLLPVYELLSAGQWPETGAERDALCQRWECSSRQLYAWRRDVLFCFWYAFVTDNITSA